MTLQRRDFIRTASAALSGGVVVGAAHAEEPPPTQPAAPPKITWRLTSSFPKSLDIPFGVAQRFAKAVADATDNAFEIKVFAAGEVVPSQQALESVTSGVVECAHGSVAPYVAKEPILGLGSGAPFGLNQRQHSAWWRVTGNTLFNEGLKKFNAHGMPLGCAGAVGGGWFRNEIRSPQDFSGLKIRAVGLGAQVFERMGALPQQLTVSEIGPALANGTIDAAAYFGPHDDEKLGLQQAAKIFHTPGWWQRAATLHLMINLEAWEKLPKPYQTVVALAAQAADAWMLARYDTLNAQAMKRLIGAGVHFLPFPPDVLEACFKATGEQYADLAGQNALFKRGLELMSAFRTEQASWWQMSEFAGESFMAAHAGRG